MTRLSGDAAKGFATAAQIQPNNIMPVFAIVVYLVLLVSFSLCKIILSQRYYLLTTDFKCSKILFQVFNPYLRKINLKKLTNLFSTTQFIDTHYIPILFHFHEQVVRFPRYAVAHYHTRVVQQR